MGWCLRMNKKTTIAAQDNLEAKWNNSNWFWYGQGQGCGSTISACGFHPSWECAVSGCWGWGAEHRAPLPALPSASSSPSLGPRARPLPHHSHPQPSTGPRADSEPAREDRSSGPSSTLHVLALNRQRGCLLSPRTDQVCSSS